MGNVSRVYIFLYFIYKYKSAPRPSFARFVIRFIFYIAYYCLKSQSNAARNKLTLIFCPLTDDSTCFQGLPCFHTCQSPVDDLLLISADDLQISYASLQVVCKRDKQSTKTQQNAVTSMLQAQITKSTRKLYLPCRSCKINQIFLYVKYKPPASCNFLKLSDENLLIYFIWLKVSWEDLDFALKVQECPDFSIF